MKDRERLLLLCLKSLKEFGRNEDARYKERLKREIKEIDAQGEHEYLLKLYDEFQEKKLMYPYNENNLLVDFLLRLAPDFDIDKDYDWVQGEFPDIDTDYLKAPREYLKRDWVPRTFGQENTCEISTYSTSGIKSAMLDMARVHNLPSDEIQQITNKITDKDEDGNELEWDQAMEIYPDLKGYCVSHPDVSEAAFLLLERRRNHGIHAGGLIISDKRIDGFVPLEVRSVKKETPNGIICSAWTEGLNSQDLGPVGLIKFDMLGVKNIDQTADCCKLIKDRYGIESICARPGDWDWSDISYLNDPKCIEMANRADLRCIFQFDGDGMRKLVKRGGVTSFDDLPAYSALYRPGPLGMGMDVRYCRRKKWAVNKNAEDGEPFNIHPVMQPSLAKTYGVLVYQEQVMDILRVVGQIPDMHTEKVRKAISKKKVEQFIKYKEMFIENGQRVLNVNEDYVLDLWNQIESFAAYGFNASHAYAYAYISARLLWLKAHYPTEFYTAILMHQADHDKIKNIKLDAKNHGVTVKPVHINKSKANFAISDKDVYFGFSNIKKIGEAVADRIVEQQPYSSFVDFLDRFGTDATPIKALTALGVFEEQHDRLHLRKFSEYYKDQIKKRKDRQKRHEASIEKKHEELRELLLEEVSEDDPEFTQLCQFTPQAQALWEQKFIGIHRTVHKKIKGVNVAKEVPFTKFLEDLARKRESSLTNFAEKEKDSEETPLTLDQFNPCKVELVEEEMAILTDELEVDGIKTFPKAESEYYGFQWTHRLETSPDYTGRTLDVFLKESEQGLVVGMVEVEIKAVRPRTSKNGVQFYSIDIEDANGTRMVVNVWQDDFTRFQDELKAGHFVKMRVRPPSGGFNTLTFDSVPRQERKKLPPKEEDIRLLMMRIPDKPKVKQRFVLDELTFDASAISGLDELLIHR